MNAREKLCVAHDAAGFAAPGTFSLVLWLAPSSHEGLSEIVWGNSEAHQCINGNQCRLGREEGEIRTEQVPASKLYTWEIRKEHIILHLTQKQ